MSRDQWMFRGSAFFLTAALSLGALLPLSAQAHALLVKAEPARRAVVSRAPHQVKLWFNEEIEAAYTKLAILDSAGKPVTDAKFQVPASDRKLMVLALPDLVPGKYTVKFRVLSVDGHVVESSYDFTFKGDAAKK